MSGKRYTEEFKIEAVKQVTERGYSFSEVAERLATSPIKPAPGLPPFHRTTYRARRG